MSVRTHINPGYKTHRLTVLREIEPKNKMRRFLCQCECGNTSTVWLSGLRGGVIRSCGCYLREKARETAIKYFRKPDGVALFNELAKRYRHAAVARNLPFNLTCDQLRAIVQSPCIFCGRPPWQVMRRIGRYGTYTHTGVDRLDSSKGYVSGNCVPCCKTCNFAKQKMKVSEFLSWAALVAKHMQGKDSTHYYEASSKFA